MEAHELFFGMNCFGNDKTRSNFNDFFLFIFCLYSMLGSNFSQTKKPLVHHMTLFECSTSAYPSSDPLSWDIWVKSSGAVCNSNLLTPRDWDACITPVAVWTISSTGTYRFSYKRWRNTFFRNKLKSNVFVYTNRRYNAQGNTSMRYFECWSLTQSRTIVIW